MFVYDNVLDKDVTSYEYELYEDDQVTGTYPNFALVSNPTIYSSGTSGATVFTVAVDNSTDVENIKYYGRVRTLDSSGNTSSWSPLVESDDTPLIGDEYIVSLTAEKITAGKIGAHEIILTQAGPQTNIAAPANMAILRSSDYNGSYNNNTNTWTNGTDGWIIAGDGHAEFSSASIRGTLKADSVYIDADNRWRRNANDTITVSEFKVGSNSKFLYFDGTNLSFTGNISLGSTIGTTLVDDIEESIIDFNLRNNRNTITPTTPTFTEGNTVIQHTVNTDGSVNISFEWNYTVSTSPPDPPGQANNIDGFNIYVRSSDSNLAYSFGTTPSEETEYTVDSDKRALILYGVAANKYYNFGIRAFRVVDTDLIASGIVTSTIVQSTFAGNNPYRPSSQVSFGGDITGTINGSNSAVVINGLLNFNANNDRKNTTPAIANSITLENAISNLNATIDLPVTWTFSGTGDAYDIDGYILYLRTTSTSNASNIGSEFAIQSLTSNVTTATIQTASNHGLSSNNKVHISGANPDFYNGTYPVTVLNTTQFTYTPTLPQALPHAISTLTSVGTTATLTTTSNHGLSNGNRVVISGVTPSGYNGIYTVTVSSPTQFTYTLSSSQSAVTTLGRCGLTSITSFGSFSNEEALNSSNIQQVYLTAEKRAHTFSGISPSSFYRAAVRAFRLVDADVNSSGMIFGPLRNTTQRASNTPILGGNTISIGDGKIYIGNGFYANANTGFFVNSASHFSLGDKLTWNGNTLTVQGTLKFPDGNTPGTFNNGDNLTSGTIAGLTINATKIFFGTGTYGNANTAFYVDNTGQFSLKDKLTWDGNILTVSGTINANSGNFSGNIFSTATIVGGTIMTNSTGTSIRLDSSTNALSFKAGSADVAHLTPLTIGGTTYGLIMHYGSVADPTAGSYPQIYIGPGNISMGISPTQMFAIGGGQLFTIVDGEVEVNCDYFRLNSSIISGQNRGIIYHASNLPANDGFGISFGYQNDGSLLSFVVDNNVGVRGYITKTMLSDRRLKENIISSVFDEAQKVYALNTIKFNYKNDTPTPFAGENSFGLIADEVSELIPKAVLGEAITEGLVYSYADKSGNFTAEEMELFGSSDKYRFTENGVVRRTEYQEIDYTIIVPYLVAALKDLNERLANLENI